MKKNLFALAASLLIAAPGIGSMAGVRENFDSGWKFAFGDAADPARDFGCGTEYFNYLTKAASIHNEGPYSAQFDSSKWNREWVDVVLPHDWVVDLPFSGDASHSHGYKTVGYRYPETSVGWYRKTFVIPAEDAGRHVSLRFDGIFRDARIWVNGFYLGSEPSGYATQVYDISEYLNYGGENVVAVRVDATLEEGWFYEGAGIYRHVWIDKSDPLHVAPFGTFVHYDLEYPYDEARIHIETTVDNKGNSKSGYSLRHKVKDPSGRVVATVEGDGSLLQPKESATTVSSTVISGPVLWDIDSPRMYSIETEVIRDGVAVDTYVTRTGIRDARFDTEEGFFLNSRHVKLKGVNMHQDHAGVGAAIPDAIQAYRLRELKKYGVNAYRSSHNPMTPEMLDACDSIGILVLEENRLTGINDEHVRLLRRMIERDRNHPSVILWSVGNEEWGTEWNDFGLRISESMREYCHRFDPTRPMCIATSGGPHAVVPVDIAGYNYIDQNNVDDLRVKYPSRISVGTEEISGRGTRGVYYADHDNGRMVSLNREKYGKDSIYNCIEKAWKFHYERPWSAGLFYWTGFDYRGEPNPMKYPATGSQPGVLDYCGFPKDFAYYLKSWWTDEPVLHLAPHWNLSGHVGETVLVQAYSNMDEVELFVNGKSHGRKKMPLNGHLSWDAVYRPGNIRAVGYRNGRKAMETKVETTGRPAGIIIEPDRSVIKADNADVAVVNVRVVDSWNRFVPDADVLLNLSLNGPARILGVGNGDPAYRDTERPENRDDREYSVRTFNGLAQILLQSSDADGLADLTVASDGLKSSSVRISIE